MIKKMKNEKGITITTLVITVILMMIMTVIISKNARTTMQVSNLTRLQNDIEALNDRISTYYVRNNSLPIIDESGFVYDKTTLQKEIKDEISVNDGEKYYTIDISKIDNITLNYGNDYEKPSTMDRYIINEETHVIYYLKGIHYEGKTYHTIGDNPPVV